MNGKVIETDCHAMNGHFISWLQSKYMKSDYVESMDFPEYLWRFSDGMKKKWEAENGG